MGKEVIATGGRLAEIHRRQIDLRNQEILAIAGRRSQEFGGDVKSHLAAAEQTWEDLYGSPSVLHLRDPKITRSELGAGKE